MVEQGITADKANNGAAARIIVRAFSDKDFQNAITGEDGNNLEYSTYLNPTKYAFNNKIDVGKDQAPGTSDLGANFVKKLPEELDIEFLFDRTGILPEYEALSDGIYSDLDLFKKVILQYNGDFHKPNYVTITWGSMLFKGCMLDLNVEYKLFKPNGAPIRAVAKVKFIGFTSDELRAAKEKKSSPDLTHIRTVKEGDTLPLMTYRIYGDSKYYLEVARVNKLPNFRKLTTGQQIYFPPIQKQS